jgi:porin
MGLTHSEPAGGSGFHLAVAGLLALSAAATAQAQPPPAAAQPPVPAAPGGLPGGPATDLLTGAPPAAETPPEPPAPPPYGGPLAERAKLTGDWFGARSALRDRGVTWDVSSTNFYQGVTSGGLNREFRYGGRADYVAAIDGAKAGLWDGLFVNLHGETLYGTSVNSFTGALLPVSIAQSVPLLDRSVTALTGVKVTQALSKNFAVFAGKINTADDFNQPFTGGARGVNGFWNTGMLIPPVLARTIPYSTFGAGFAVLRDLQPVLAVSVFDTHNTPTVSGFDRFFTNGATVTAQGNLPVTVAGRPGHYSVGGSYSSGKYAALDNNLPYLITQRLQGLLPPLPRETGSWAVYGLFDQAVWADAESKRSWGVFGHAGISDGNPNPIRWSSNVGVGGSSPLASRKLDTFGVGYFYIGLSESLRNFAPRLFPLRDEHGVELFYNVGVTPWCHVTPDLQIVTPVRDRVDTSVNFGIRAKIDF